MQLLAKDREQRLQSPQAFLDTVHNREAPLRRPGTSGTPGNVLAPPGIHKYAGSNPACCPTCAADLTTAGSGALYCVRCGSSLTQSGDLIHCIACGALLAGGAYCPSCSAPFGSTDHRITFTGGLLAGKDLPHSGRVVLCGPSPAAAARPGNLAPPVHRHLHQRQSADPGCWQHQWHGGGPPAPLPPPSNLGITWPL